MLTVKDGLTAPKPGSGPGVLRLPPLLAGGLLHPARHRHLLVPLEAALGSPVDTLLADLPLLAFDPGDGRGNRHPFIAGVLQDRVGDGRRLLSLRFRQAVRVLEAEAGARERHVRPPLRPAPRPGLARPAPEACSPTASEPPGQ